MYTYHITCKCHNNGLQETNLENTRYKNTIKEQAASCFNELGKRSKTQNAPN